MNEIFDKKFTTMLNEAPRRPIGTDPEVFICDENGGDIESAKLLKPVTAGTQATETEFVSDGFQAEIHTKPVGCREILIGQIQKALVDGLTNIHKTAWADKKIKKQKFSFKCQPMIALTETQLKKLTAPSLQFNCATSINAYDDEVEYPDPTTHTYRYAGGHMHFSIEKSVDPVVLAKIMDIFVGLPSVMFAPDAPLEMMRRKFYGRAGEFRYKDNPKNEYAVFEYRVPSNFWLRTPEMASLMFLWGRKAIDVCTSYGDTYLTHITRAMTEDIKSAINNIKSGTAKRLYILLAEPFNFNQSAISPIMFENIIASRIHRAPKNLDNWNIKLSGFQRNGAPMFMRGANFNGFCSYVRQFYPVYNELKQASEPHRRHMERVFGFD